MIGFFSANSSSDDNEISANGISDQPSTVVHTLRQQVEKPPGRPNCSLADFIAPEELITEQYRGFRPALGYPACPDHTEKGILFNLLNVEENTGMTLTESYAMRPAAAVSGYFLHTLNLPILVLGASSAIRWRIISGERG